MKIPISLSFKLFDEHYIVKKKVDCIHIGEVAEMYKTVFIPVFGEQSYENIILSIAEEIKQKRKKPLLVRCIQHIKNIFNETD